MNQQIIGHVSFEISHLSIEEGLVGIKGVSPLTLWHLKHKIGTAIGLKSPEQRMQVGRLYV